MLDISLSGDNYESSTRTFSDRSGLGNNGISVNNALFSNGKYGSVDGAMNFNGASDVVKISNIIVSNPNELTISAWFKKESGGSTYECVLHQNSNYTIGASAYWLGVDSTDYLTATIGANTGVGWVAGKTDIKAIYGEWYHLLATWDGSVVKVFVNGEYVKQYSLTSYTNQTSPTRIGASADSGTNYWFRGEIEGVKILNYSLSDEEVENLYMIEVVVIQVLSLGRMVPVKIVRAYLVKIY
ncbi:LamG domain-containing protein [Candidatus Falkowbacteria bacterium]|nr:LamG domain-containing protein [Candidatus Falkowbacteria bacterium]